jgi:hypothetical protein
LIRIGTCAATGLLVTFFVLPMSIIAQIPSSLFILVLNNSVNS